MAFISCLIRQELGIIVVLGLWQLHDADGEMIDQTQEHPDRQYYRIHVLLNADVTDFSINPLHSFTLKFSTGHQLTIYDDTPQYESLSLTPGLMDSCLCPRKSSFGLDCLGGLPI
jgi:hypothetical protein